MCYQGDVMSVGSKRFELDMSTNAKGESDNYVLVVSARMRMDQIDMFDMSESYALLRKAITLLLEMRRPDLEYLLLNSFESLTRTDFFIAQEVL